MRYRVAKKILKLKDTLSYRKDQIARAEAVVAKRGKGPTKQKEAKSGKTKSKGKRHASAEGGSASGGKEAKKEETKKEIKG